MVRLLHLATLCPLLYLVASFHVTFKVVTNTLNKEQYREYIENKAHKYRRGHYQQRARVTPRYRDLKTTYITYVPYGGRFSYDHDRTPYANFRHRKYETPSVLTTTFNPYVDYNMPNFPFHLYQTNVYAQDAQFNITFAENTPYTTTENVLILYDDILRKKLTNHRARLFNNYDRHFPILFKRAWKYAVGK